MTRGARFLMGVQTLGFNEPRRPAQSRGGAGGGLAAQQPNILAGAAREGGASARLPPPLPSGRPPPV